MLRTMGTLIVLTSLTACGSAQQSQPRRTLSVSEARRIVMAVPEVAKAAGLGRCPKAELTDLFRQVAFFQVRSTCIGENQGSGLIGNYTVDRHTGEIWYDVDKTPETLIDSPELTALRKELLGWGKKSRGKK